MKSQKKASVSALKQRLLSVFSSGLSTHSTRIHHAFTTGLFCPRTLLGKIFSNFEFSFSSYRKGLHSVGRILDGLQTGVRL